MTYDHSENKKLYCEDWIETDEPWTRWECWYAGYSAWLPLLSHPSFDNRAQYRRIDPYRELKEAAADPTKQIRCAKGGWRDAGFAWKFDGDISNYEVRDKPKTVKYYMCYESKIGGNLYWLREDFMSPKHDALRVPEFDKELS